MNLEPKLIIEATILVMPSIWNDPISKSDLDVLLSEICEFRSGAELVLHNFKDTVIEVEAVQSLADKSILSDAWSVFDLESARFLKITAILTKIPQMCLTAFDKNDLEKNDFSKTARKVAKMYFSAEVLEFICRINLAANIARPGVFNVSGGYYFIDGTLGGSLQILNNRLEHAIDISVEKGWPLIDKLKSNEVMSWLNTFPGFLEGMPAGRIGTLLSCFTHLFRSDLRNGYQEILWVMAGLEALFSEKDNSDSNRKQFVKKIHFMLGKPPEGFEKTLKKLYDFRSDFVHGALNIPVAYKVVDDLYEKFELEADINVSILTAVLIATLQKVVVNSWINLNFFKKESYEIIAEQRKC